MILLSLFSCFCYGQNSFNLGFKAGYGTSAFPMNASLKSNGTWVEAKSGSTLSIAIAVRYIIADRFGIESGLYANHYSFYYEDDFKSEDAFWKTSAAMEIPNYQVPLLLNYKIKFTRQPYTYIMASAGTTIDWFFSHWLGGTSSSLRPEAFRNLAGALKVGKEKLNGKMEIGLEAQYSLREFEFTNQNYHLQEQIIRSRLNMLSLNVAFFFLNSETKPNNI